MFIPLRRHVTSGFSCYREKVVNFTDYPLILYCALMCYYLLPAAEGCGREIIKYLLCLCTFMCPSVRSLHICINLNILFIFKDIFTKFAANVYGYEILSVQNFSLILKNKMAAIANCLKIIKVL